MPRTKKIPHRAVEFEAERGARIKLLTKACTDSSLSWASKFLP